MSEDKVQQSGGTYQKVEISERTLSILALVFAVCALVLAFWARSESEKSARETRVLQQIAMDRDALLLRAGILQMADATNGPAYNLQYKKE